MKLIIKFYIGGQVAHEQVLHLGIVCFFTDEAMSGQHAVGIGIHHKNGFLRGIKQDGVRGFRADPFDREQLFPQDKCFPAEKAIQITGGFFRAFRL